MVNLSEQQRSTEDQVGWRRPKLDELDLHFLYTLSVLGEFVQGHDASDVLRELVQNEFDAQGTRLEIAFGTDSLRVRGNGVPIDAAGWKRLTVMLGQGQVAGSDLVIKPKTNGIGSKNFGLKSLFLFGPQIFIRSAGWQTVLDYKRGTQPKPLAEPDSKRKPGIEIHVPYRIVADGNLVPFGLAEEEHAIDQLDRTLIPTLIKLVEPDSAKQLKQLVVTSERYDRRIRWTQSAKKIDCSARYVTAIQRTLRMEHGQMDENVSVRRQTISETEFQKSFELPVEFRHVTFPSYFRVSGRRRIKIGISVRTKGGKIDLGHRGQFFYPLGVPDGQSGNNIDISAPFKMDMDRSTILGGGNTWNSWLLRCAADLTMDLLAADWFGRFGSAAYLAAFPSENLEESSNEYCSTLMGRLSTDECWPTRAVAKRRKQRTVFNKANQIVIPDAKELDDFLTPIRYLDRQFAANEDIRKMSIRFGARSFTINSLIRLRCAGKEGQHLSTRLEKSEAGFYSGNLQSYWSNIERQKRFAQALDVFARKLSTPNREDVKRANTTLNAEEGLRAPDLPLWVVNDGIDCAIDLALSHQLHPDLRQYQVLPKLCKMFDTKTWIRETAEKIRLNTATQEERNALYSHVIERRGQFDQTIKAILRRSPILKNDRGSWVTPETITDARARNANDLRPVLYLPHPDFAQDAQLAKSLGFKKQVTGEDLVEYAKLVQKNPDMAESCASALWTMRRLLDSKIISQLSTVPVVRNSLGGLTCPPDTYLRTSLNETCLGPETPFVIGEHLELYEILGCRTTPRSQDILEHIQALRLSGQKPENAKVLYVTLVQALKLERKPTNTYEAEHILWADGDFHQPIEVLVGKGYRRIFRGSVPQLAAPSGYLQAARDLGAQPDPKPQHWMRLLRWFSDNWGGPDASITLPHPERETLRQVYATLPAPPDGMSTDDCFLLGKNGRLYSRTEAVEGILIIDDDPQLASELEGCQSPVAFADISKPGSLRFFTAASVQNLTAVLRLDGLHIGDEVSVSGRVNVDATLKNLQSDEFGSAFSRLLDYNVRTGQDDVLLQPLELLAELKKRSSITFVDKLQATYTVAEHTVSVNREIVLENERFVLIKALSNLELRDRLSNALAGLVTEAPVVRRSLADSIFRLLAAGGSTNDMKRYLNGRGISWEWNTDTELEQWEDQSMEIEANQGEDDVNDYVRRMLDESLVRPPSQEVIESNQRAVASISTTNHIQNTTTTAPPTKLRVLPSIEEVTPQRIPREDTLHIRQPRQPRTSGSSFRWSPPTPEQEVWERAIGRRGEELIHREELERVQKLGYPASRVKWVSDQNPGADHDILSVDCDGQDLVIEVKSTSGKDGRFQWSKNEFDLARALRERYVLYRVYEADSSTPSVKSFRDPVGLLLQNALHLDVNSLSAEVESV